MVPLTAASRVTLLRVTLIPLFLVVLVGEWPDALSPVIWWEIVKPWTAALIFTILAATDAVDGYLARSRNEVTTFGKLIDPLADKLLVTAALFALVDLDLLPAWVAIIIVSREFIVSGLRMVSLAEGKVIEASWYGKAKTVTQIVAIALFIVKDSSLIALLWDGALGSAEIVAWLAMTIALVMTLLSMVDYFVHARDVLIGPWNKGASVDG